jgi:DNA replication protein DnaC
MCIDAIDVTVFDSIGFAEELERRYRNEDDVRGWLDRVTEAPVICFDDFMKCKVSERVATELYALVDRRVHSGLPILATMNESGDDIARLDKRFPYMVRRLREFSVALDF